MSRQHAWYGPIPLFNSGDLITAAKLNEMVSAINRQFRRVACDYCGGSHCEDRCPSCGAPRRAPRE